jgi:hypothetical protein
VVWRPEIWAQVKNCSLKATLNNDLGKVHIERDSSHILRSHLKSYHSVSETGFLKICGHVLGSPIPLQMWDLTFGKRGAYFLFV